MIAELLLNKLQDELGANYKLMLYNQFEHKYTNALNKTIEKQAFEDYKDTILGILSLNPMTFAVTPFLSYATIYKLELWVPVDNVKEDADGNLLETPKFNVFDDLQTLITDCNNKTIIFGTYRGQLTFSDPIVNTSIDDTGIYRREVVTLSGSFDITDKGLYGRDTTVKLGIYNEETEGNYDYYAIEGVTSRVINSLQNGISANEQGETVPTQDGETVSNDISLNINDYETTNAANKLIIDRAYGKDVSITEIPVQIYRNGIATLTGDGETTEYEIDTDYTINSVDVYIAGKSTTAYTLANKTITFMVAPDNNAKILVIYNYLMASYNALLSATLTHNVGDSGIGSIKVALTRVKE